jgi:hypothetical protein
VADPPRRRLWSPLARRGFCLLLASDVISNVGDWLYNIVLLVFVFERTGSAAWVAVASIVRIAPEIGLSTLGGWWPIATTGAR